MSRPHWQDLRKVTDPSWRRRDPVLAALHRVAVEALAIHHEHRSRDLDMARELALVALEEDGGSTHADGMRHRLARLDRKLERKKRAGSENRALQFGFGEVNP